MHISVDRTVQCGTKVLILLYLNEEEKYHGVIPNDQDGVRDHIRMILQQRDQKQKQKQKQVINIQQLSGSERIILPVEGGFTVRWNVR